MLTGSVSSVCTCVTALASSLPVDFTASPSSICRHPAFFFSILLPPTFSFWSAERRGTLDGESVGGRDEIGADRVDGRSEIVAERVGERGKIVAARVDGRTQNDAGLDYRFKSVWLLRRRGVERTDETRLGAEIGLFTSDVIRGT